MYSMNKRSRFNLRQKARVSYYEPEEPNLDEYVFCAECGDFVYEYCSIHGPLLVIPDDKVPIKPDVPSFVPRAALTIPNVFLHINYSRIPGAGLGIFTTLTLPRGVRFGPYKGRMTDKIASSYCWQIRDSNNRPCHVVDASDSNNSNWMRYVNCSRHWFEQNLVAYQYRGQIYYRTIKIIPRFTELMVFYGSEFACELGIDLKKYNSPPTFAQKLGTQIPKKVQTKNPPQHNMEQIIKDSSKKSDILQEKTKKINIVKTNITSNPSIKHKVETKTTLEQAAKPLPTNEISNAANIESIKSIDIENTATLIEKELANSHKVSKNNSSSNLTKDISDVNSLESQSNCKGIIKDGNNNYKRVVLTKYTCDICQFVTNKERYLENHLLLHGNVKGIKFFKCKYCLHVCKTKSSKLIHELSHTSDTPYICDICKRTFSQSSSLITHKRTHSGDKPYTCDICKRTFSQSSNLITHKRTHTGDKPYTCDICKRAFSESGALTTHKRTHTGDRPYTCDICKRAFSVSSHLTAHKRTHTGDKPYTCDICKRAFSQSGDLTKHKRTHTGDKPYTCDICKRTFSQSSNLITHKRTHTGDKPYTCDICKRAFSESSYLTRHKRTHTGDKPYTCDICKRAFSESSHLTRHKRMHTGDKPYTCDICKRAFSESSYLTRHKRTHTGDKPYTCDICKRAFSESSYLTRHKRTHTGDKPYTCDICKRAFSESSHLTRHKRTHTGDKPYTCDIICKRGFAHRGSLTTHIRTHTGNL